MKRMGKNTKKKSFLVGVVFCFLFLCFILTIVNYSSLLANSPTKDMTVSGTTKGGARKKEARKEVREEHSDATDVEEVPSTQWREIVEKSEDIKPKPTKISSSSAGLKNKKRSQKIIEEEQIVITAAPHSKQKKPKKLDGDEQVENLQQQEGKEEDRASVGNFCPDNVLDDAKAVLEAISIPYDKQLHSSAKIHFKSEKEPLVLLQRQKKARKEKTSDDDGQGRRVAAVGIRRFLAYNLEGAMIIQNAANFDPPAMQKEQYLQQAAAMLNAVPSKQRKRKRGGDRSQEEEGGKDENEGGEKSQDTNDEETMGSAASSSLFSNLIVKHSTLPSMSDLLPGWYCFSVSDVSQQCSIASTPFVVMEVDRHNSEYAVSPTFLSPIIFEVIFKGSSGGLRKSKKKNNLEESSSGIHSAAAVYQHRLSPSVSLVHLTGMVQNWMVPRQGIKGLPLVAGVSILRSPEVEGNIGGEDELANFDFRFQSSSRINKNSDDEKRKKKDNGGDDLVYDERIALVNGVLEVFAGRGTFWIVDDSVLVDRDKDEAQQRASSSSSLQQKGKIWNAHYEPGIRQASTDDVLQFALKTVEFVPLSSFLSVRTSIEFLEAIRSGKKHIRVKKSLAIGSSIDVPSGLLIVLDANVIITLNPGESLKVSGTAEDPVTFTSSDPNTYWGGILLSERSSASFEYTIFSFAGGGGGKHKVPGTGTHIKNAMPIFTATPATSSASSSSSKGSSEATALHLYECLLANSIGPGIGAGANTKIKVERTIFQDLEQGGECVDCHMELKNSHILDIPYVPVSMRKQFVDKDNDGFYFRGGEALVDSCVIMNTLDDGIDSASSSKKGGRDGMLSSANHHHPIDGLTSRLSVRDSYIRNCQHEGIALSASQGTTRDVLIEGTFISRTQQAIEVGYTPKTHHALVQRCKLVHNQIGIRYGDNYQLAVEGNLLVEDSVFYKNVLSVLNYVRSVHRSRRKKQQPSTHSHLSNSVWKDVVIAPQIPIIFSSAENPRMGTRGYVPIVIRRCSFVFDPLLSSGGSGHHRHHHAAENSQPQIPAAGPLPSALLVEGQQEMAEKGDRSTYDVLHGFICGAQHFVSEDNKIVSRRPNG